MKSVYGPVSSWRLGRSLGIDPICSQRKICSFDCVYCQLGHGTKTYQRRVFVDTDTIRRELQEALPQVEADVITFSGTGEPTLAANLGEVIDYVRSVSRIPLAILTNSSLLGDENVVRVLYNLDIVVAKLDAHNQALFKKINQPYQGLDFQRMVEDMIKFRRVYDGKFSLQLMFVPENERYAEDIARIVERIGPDEIQINTPLRPCKVRPLDSERIQRICEEFRSLGNVISVYEAERPEVCPLNLEEIRKRKRPEP